MRRLIVWARYWWWRVQGTGGHLPNCSGVVLEYVGRAGGQSRAWQCAPGCPVRVRQQLASTRYIERWGGHR